MTTINERLLRTLLAETASELRAGKYPPLSRRQLLSLDYNGRLDDITGAHFNMSYWNFQEDCGSVRCIGGILSSKGYSAEASSHGPGLDELFFMSSVCEFNDEQNTIIRDVTSEQAARAIDNYLQSGDPKWKEVLA